jgi:hypothetical protein
MGRQPGPSRAHQPGGHYLRQAVSLNYDGALEKDGHAASENANLTTHRGIGRHRPTQSAGDRLPPGCDPMPVVRCGPSTSLVDWRVRSVDALPLAPPAGVLGVPPAGAGAGRVIEEQVARRAGAAPLAVRVECAKLLDQASGQRRGQ